MNNSNFKKLQSELNEVYELNRAYEQAKESYETRKKQLMEKYLNDYPAESKIPFIDKAGSSHVCQLIDRETPTITANLVQLQKVLGDQFPMYFELEAKFKSKQKESFLSSAFNPLKTGLMKLAQSRYFKFID